MPLLLLLALVLSACSRAPNPPQEPSPSETLDRLDARRPLPLLPMMALHQKESMRDHLVAVQEIVSALAAEDYEAVARAARRIGTSEEMRRMCNHMGAGAPGFTEQALGFHEQADAIEAAAEEENAQKVLAALGATLRTCTSCHEVWKQQVVDQATWEQAAGIAAPHAARD